MIHENSNTRIFLHETFVWQEELCIQRGKKSDGTKMMTQYYDVYNRAEGIDPDWNL